MMADEGYQLRFKLDPERVGDVTESKKESEKGYRKKKIVLLVMFHLDL